VASSALTNPKDNVWLAQDQRMKILVNEDEVDLIARLAKALRGEVVTRTTL
jgi:hypothetical protein